MTIPRWGWIALAAIVAVGLIGGTIWWLRARSLADLPSLQPSSAAGTTPTPGGAGQGSATTSAPRTPIPGDEPVFFLPEIPTIPSIDPTLVPTPAQNVEVAPSAPTTPVAVPADADGDGLTDEQEANALTDPKVTDTDADTLSDGDEIKKYRTDPLKKDSDGDGYTDAQEIENGYNPVGTGKCLTTGCVF